MGVNRFEDLRVWQAARTQCDRVGALIKRPEFRRDQELTGQMNDAAISVTLNISEGFLRRRDKETKPDEIGGLIELNESIAKMLRRWQATLEDDGTPIRGPRPKRGPGAKDGPRTKNEGPGTNSAGNR